MSRYQKIVSLMIIILILNFSLLPAILRAESVLRGQDRGQAVRELQLKLKELGYYNGRIDGVFGVRTELSLRDFQKDVGLIEDGIAGSRTMEAIKSELADEEREQQKEKEPVKYPLLRRGDRGDGVLRLQEKLREKGFLTADVDGVFGLQTTLAVKLAQEFYGLQADGVVGRKTWEALNREETVYRTYTVKKGDTLWDLSRRWSISRDRLKAINNLKNADFIRTGDQLRLPGEVKPAEVEIVHWHQVDGMIQIDEVLILTDVETGLSFRVKRLGGTNHADVEPLTAEDTQVFKRIYGGQWSWERRALIAHINGRRIAASINGQPHANQSIMSNQFPGHICLHFEGSKLHKEEKQDYEHQEMVEKAGNQDWPLVNGDF